MTFNSLREISNIITFVDEKRHSDVTCNCISNSEEIRKAVRALSPNHGQNGALIVPTVEQTELSPETSVYTFENTKSEEKFGLCLQIPNSLFLSNIDKGFRKDCIQQLAKKIAPALRQMPGARKQCVKYISGYNGDVKLLCDELCIHLESQMPNDMEATKFKKMVTPKQILENNVYLLRNKLNDYATLKSLENGGRYTRIESNNEKHCDIVSQWYQIFCREVGVNASAAGLKRILSRPGFFWVDKYNQMVCMAFFSGYSSTIARIGYVQFFLKISSGRKCFILADQKVAGSNKAYTRVGFEKIDEIALWVF
ncbi:hypothetical protein RFI_08466 [Reticulomyxa filosa]|uniref:Uncharacterized protein n=1 Tax=Reticulomyxa filosa TaxID=46433 RepID=X6NRU6_RETFI|nr:hypothetical protein RFI_08466 [Reticulomyxa filosa]|eukprot:ETO28663.1 hypothetical protein RFI_08466 [Reticulomyxa filosa]